jgi:Holliday junction resolvase RusA-like endonuclease
LDALYGQAAVTSAAALAAVVAAFNDEFAAGLDTSDLSAAQREQLREYIVRSLIEGNATLYHRVPVLSRLPLYEDAAAKMSWLQQHPCPVCPAGGEVPPVTFPVGIPPWSHQSTRHVGAALRRAIDSSPRYRDHFKDRAARGPVCLRLVFVLPEGATATMKDCDNMAKGVMDAFQGLLYENDNQVEHLDLFKARHSEASSGYILIRRTATSINDHSDVLVPHHARLAWMTAEDLRIDDYLRPSSQ